MGKDRKQLNSKKKRIIVIATLIALVLISAIIFFVGSGKNHDENVEVGRGEELNGSQVNNESETSKESLEYLELSEEKYKIDTETNTISLNKSLRAASICMSTSPNGPRATDTWISTNGETSFELVENLNAKEEKMYVYYMASMIENIGTGNTDATMFLINTAEDIQTFANMVNSGNSFEGKQIYLKSNITLPSSFTPIGTTTTPFSGIFNGNGYSINGVNLDLSTANVGLFGYIRNATIQNVIVNGTQVNGGDSTGAIVGTGNGIIENCINNVPVTSNGNNVGGIAGSFVGMVRNCENTAAVNGSQSVGGIVGLSSEGLMISNCKNSATGIVTASSSQAGGIVGCANNCEYIKTSTNEAKITGAGYTAGIIGFANNTESTRTLIEKCKNMGEIRINGAQGGGIIGQALGVDIEYCINTAKVYATSYRVGGICGEATTLPTHITYCRNTGTIYSENAQAGGIAGRLFGESDENYSSIRYCSNVGFISGWTTQNSSKNGHGVGGIAGDMRYGEIDGCYVLIVDDAGTYSTSGVGIYGYRYIGGIVGSCISTSENSNSDVLPKATIKNCYVGARLGIWDGGNSSKSKNGFANYVWYQSYPPAAYSNNFWFGSADGGAMYRRWISGEPHGRVTTNATATDFIANSGGIYVDDVYDINKAHTSYPTQDWVLFWEVEPLILRHPIDFYGPQGTSTTLDIEDNGGANTYQWYSSFSKEGPWSKIEGATSISYDTTVANKNIYYYCEVTGVKYYELEEEGAIDETQVIINSEVAVVGPTKNYGVTGTLMERYDTTYVIGASTRDGGSTNYLAEKVKTINVIDMMEEEMPDGSIGSWDVSKDENGAIIAYLYENEEDTSMYDLYLVSVGGITLPENSSYMFANYNRCTKINGLNLVSSNKATTMESMFEYCDSLEKIDLENFDTSKVRNMQNMFFNCRSLTSIGLENFNTKNVTTMENMFMYCEDLTTLDLSKFNTSNVETMKNMFSGCFSLTTLNVSGFNTSKVKNTKGMFASCRGLTTIDISSFDTSKIKDMSGMFKGCYFLTTLDLRNLNTSSVTTMEDMFASCVGLTSLDVSNFNTSNVQYMQNMFYRCDKLTSLDVRTFETQNVKNMSGMFNLCTNLESLDVKNFNTSNVINMNKMFSGCESLVKLNLSRFDTSKVLDMSYMFSDCSSLEKLDVTEFDVSSVTQMDSMFEGCSSLKGLNLRNFNNSATRTNMFKDMTSLTSILIGKNFGALNGTDMFAGCTNLTAVISQKAITTASDAPLLTTATGLKDLANVNLYVPDETSKTKYASANSYISVFTKAKIKEMIEIAGENPITVEYGSIYEDEGATVINKNKTNANEYNQYNYYIDVAGSKIDTTKPGTYEVVYTLKYAEY